MVILGNGSKMWGGDFFLFLFWVGGCRYVKVKVFSYSNVYIG